MEKQFAYTFLALPRELALYNASDSDIEIMYGGETRRLPAANRVVLPHPKYSDVCCSKKDDESGKYLPGTLVLKDIYKVNELLGGEELIWSAANAVKNTLGIDPQTGKAASRYAERGVSLIPPNATLAEIRTIAKAARRRWERFQLAQDISTVHAHEERNARREALKLGSVPPTREYMAAAERISKAKAEFLEEAAQVTYADNNVILANPVFADEVPAVDPSIPVVDLLADEPEPSLPVEAAGSPETPPAAIPEGIQESLKLLEDVQRKRLAKSTPKEAQ
jgi:hypothetical protein